MNITKETLGVSFLNITDIAELDDMFFILDKSMGIICYDIASGKVIIHNLEKDFNITQFYGMSVIYNNGVY